VSVLTEREVYRPAGKLAVDRFVPLFITALVIAVLLGGLLCVAWHTGTFFTGITPLFAGLALAGLTYAPVHWGHCRSTLVGTAAGALLGTTTYLAAYQFDLARYTGWANLSRLDRLPDHIEFRVRNDGNVLPDGRHQPNALSQNFVELAFNAAVVILIPTGVGWRNARRPYCEVRGRWMDTFAFALTIESAESVLDALAAGDPFALEEAVVPADSGALEYVAAEVLYVPRVPDSSAYLTLNRMSLDPRTRELDDRTALAARWRLATDEAAAVARAFRMSDAGFSAGPATASGKEFAPGDAGLQVDFGENRVFNGQARFVVAAMIHVPLVVCIAAAFACWLGGLALDSIMPEAPFWLLPATLGGGFVFMFLAVGVALFINVLPSRYVFARLCREIRRRPGAIVRPDDPGVVFVEVVPRRNWVPMSGENADDFGLLRVDEDRGLILFEGGAERWAVPADAVLGFDVIEYCAHPQTGEPANIPVLVLTANVGGREWERPLCLRSRECRRQNVHYRRASMDALHHLVRSVLPRDPSAPPSFRGR
jgi:hypothetical protein